MTLQQLEYIVAVDKFRHFSNAAYECGVTQSTLSAMIKKLEEEVDAIIFDRDSHPIVPTPIGEKIIAQAKVVLYNTKQLNEITLTEKEQESGIVETGVIATVAPYIIPNLFNKLNKDYPNIHLHVYEMITNNIINKLLKAELDVAIMATPLNIPDLFEVPLYYEKLVAYISPSENLYSQKEINSHDMPTTHLWMLKEGNCLRNQVFNFCEKSSEYQSIYEAGSIDTLVKIVDINGGYTVIPELHVNFLSEEQKKNVRPLVNPEPVREISLVFRQDYVKEKILNSIADKVKEIIPFQMIDPTLKKFAIKL